MARSMRMVLVNLRVMPESAWLQVRPSSEETAMPSGRAMKRVSGWWGSTATSWSSVTFQEVRMRQVRPPSAERMQPLPAAR